MMFICVLNVRRDHRLGIVKRNRDNQRLFALDIFFYRFIIGIFSVFHLLRNPQPLDIHILRTYPTSTVFMGYFVNQAARNA